MSSVWQSTLPSVWDSATPGYVYYVCLQEINRNRREYTRSCNMNLAQGTKDSCDHYKGSNG